MPDGIAGSRDVTVRLPVSGREVLLRRPTGCDELLLLESAGDAGATMALAERLARAADGVEMDWGLVAVTDLDATILRLRQMVVGDVVRADTRCRVGGCGARVDISFSIEQYLSHHAPAPAHGRGWRVAAVDEAGWFPLIDSAEGAAAVHFRLPTVSDQSAVAGRRDAADELARRCIRPAGFSARQRRRVEAAMEALAPGLSTELGGACPSCGAAVQVYFDARAFCLRELRERAAFVYQDVDLLARRYHWPEAEILALPQARRANYVELARREGGEW